MQRPEPNQDNPRPTAQILDMSGNPIPSPRVQPPPQPNPSYGSGAGGGSDPMIDIAGLKKNVGFLNWAVGLIFISGLGAILASYLMLASRVDDRYDRIGEKLDGVAQQIGDLRVDVTEVKANGDAQRSNPKR